ncbi:BnaA04g19260D [Brassica napus]|uniref:BnaA04g19260D protein n=2 Tax=Brassica napus TaxID=3708 RepID=A0A078HIQ7_BRANA|nr:BnaA04g19260D [Brassica napus]
MATQIRGKKKFVADGIFYAELNEVLTRELAKDGYVGAEVMVTTTEEVVTKISKIEEASPAMGGGVGGEGEKGSTKTKQ